MDESDLVAPEAKVMSSAADEQSTCASAGVAAACLGVAPDEEVEEVDKPTFPKDELVKESEHAKLATEGLEGDVAHVGADDVPLGWWCSSCCADGSAGSGGSHCHPGGC